MISNLPPPLTSAENLQLLKFIQAGDDEARSKIIEGNLRLAIHIARKYQNTGLNVEDLFSMATIGLIKAVNSFKLDKEVKFATYATRCMENEILMFLRRNKKHAQTKSLEDILNIDSEGSQLTIADVTPDTSIEDFALMFNDRDNEKDLVYALDKLPAHHRRIVQLRYFEGKTQVEAAEILGISQSYVARLGQRALRAIRQTINRKNGENEELTPLRKSNKSIPLKPKEEVVMSQGDVSTAIKLLKTTTLGFDAIQTVTECTLNKIHELAKTHRPHEAPKEVVEQSSFIKPESKPIQIKEENRYKGMTVRSEEEWKAIELLETTRKSYVEIANETGAVYTRVAGFGTKARSKELRKEITREQGILNAQRTNEKRKQEKKFDASQLIEDTKQVGGKVNEEKTTENPVNKEPEVEKPAQPVQEEVKATPVKSIAEAVEEFKNEIIDEYKSKLEEEAKMAETSTANQTSKEEPVSKVKRSFSFNFEASGEKVTVEEFLDEIEGIKYMIEEGKANNITFNLTVEATK